MINAKNLGFMEKYFTESEKKMRKRWRVFFLIDVCIVLLFFYLVSRLGLVSPLFFGFFYLIYIFIFYYFSYKRLGTQLLAFHYILGPLFDFLCLLALTFFGLVMLYQGPKAGWFWLFCKIFGSNLLVFSPFLIFYFFWYRSCFRLRKMNLRVKRLLKNSFQD